MCWPNPSLTSEDKYVSQLVLSKSLYCRRGHLNFCWLSPLHVSDDIKCISACVEQNPHKSTMTQNTLKHVMIKPTPCLRAICYNEITKCISTCVAQTPQTPICVEQTMTQDVSQYLLTIQSHASNICWQNPSNSCEDTKWMLLRFDKPIPWKRGQKMYLNMRWPNPCPTTEHTNCILTCFDQTQPISTSVHRTPFVPASKLNVYQLVVTKHNRCQREVLTKPNT